SRIPVPLLLIACPTPFVSRTALRSTDRINSKGHTSLQDLRAVSRRSGMGILTFQDLKSRTRTSPLLFCRAPRDIYSPIIRRPGRDTSGLTTTIAKSSTSIEVAYSGQRLQVSVPLRI